MILLAGFASLSGCARTEEQPPRLHEGNTEQDVYVCPMHPEITSAEPRRCSICNMFLVKREVVETDEPTPAD